MLSKTDRDYGTPPKISAKLVTLEVDGREVTVPEGTSVLRAAALADVAIPKLCATDSLEPFGSCRLCLVQVEGRNGYPASCTTPVESGMKVRTKSEMLERLRRGVMELYMSDHPLDRTIMRRQWQLRTARDGRRGGAGRDSLRLRGQESSERRA